MSKNGQPVGVPFYIRKSSVNGCLATTVHQSGKESLEIGVGDLLYHSDVSSVMGVVSEVRQVQATPTMWFYQVTYQPASATANGVVIKHRIGTQLKFFGRALEKFQGQPETEQVTEHAASRPASLLAATA